MGKSSQKRIKHQVGNTHPSEQPNELDQIVTELVYEEICDRCAAAISRLREPKQRVKKFFEAVNSGMEPRRAANYFLALRSRGSYDRFLERHPEFADIVNTLIGEIEQSRCKVFIESNDPSDAHKFLKAHFPSRYGDKQQIEQVTVTADGKEVLDGVFKVLAQKLSAEEYDAITAEILAKAAQSAQDDFAG